MPASAHASIELYWLPLGAGGHSVRVNGALFEAVAAGLGRRNRCDLYHAALQVDGAEGRFVVEQAPARANGRARGVVAVGPVGARPAGRIRLFRYEIRRWPGGTIADVAEAVESPVPLSSERGTAERLLALVPSVPLPVWGRDELGLGEMWNSNSVISWLLTCSGLDVDAIALPRRGRAPGWRAGVIVASRDGQVCAVVRRRARAGLPRSLRPSRSRAKN
jgi:hypothetical protein